MGVTQALFINYSISKIFDLVKVPVKFSESHLKDVIAAVKYKRAIQQLTSVLTMLKNLENNGTEEIGLETPTPDPHTGCPARDP